MSSSNYRLGLTWISQSGQLRADVDAIRAKLSGVEQVARSGTRQMGLWGQQMKAIGTTLRYAFAGAIVYGVATAITSLGEFEAKLGEIDAYAGELRDGNLRGLGDDLNKLADTALKTSNKYGLAVGGIQDQLRGFFSAGFENRSVEQAQKWADIMSQIALTTENADPAKMAIGVAGMIHNMGLSGNPAQGAATMRDIIFSTLRESTVFRGEDIARDIGRLAAAGPALRMTPEEIFAVYGTAGKAGGSAGVIGRGIAQLLTASLVNPKTDDQKKAFAALGLPTTPSALRQMGGMNVLRTLLQGIGPISGPGARALRAEDLSDEDALAGSGVSNTKIDLLYKAVGRMESVRQLLNLASLGGATAIDKFLRRLNEGEKTQAGLQAARVVNEHRWYQQMNEAQKNARLAVMKGIEPAFKDFSKAVKFVSDEAIRHPHAAAAAVGGIAGASILARVIGAGALGGLLQRIPGLNRIPGLRGLVGRAPQLGGALLVGAGTSAFTSSGTGQRSNPIWVIIDPLSWFFPGAPGSGSIPPGPGPGVKPPGGIFGKVRGRAGRPPITGGIGPLAATMGLAEIGFLLFGGAPSDSGYKAGQKEWMEVYQQHPALRNMIKAVMDFKYRGRDPRTINQNWFKAFAAMGEPGTHGFNPDKALAILAASQRASRRAGSAGIGAEVSGKADITIELIPSPSLRKVLAGQKLGVKVPLGTGTAPQHRGKKETHPGAAGIGAGVGIG